MYEDEIESRRPILFALSTCPRCQRMKDFLLRHRVDALVVDIDLLPVLDAQRHYQFIRNINPTISFPTLVVGELAVIGEDYAGAQEALGL
jgi:glutaredoxin-like protein NrdH